MKMIKQFIPQEVCLKCQGCCRFSDEVSLWSPCLLDEEIQDLLGRDIPPASISVDKKIQPVPHPAGEGFICPFLQHRKVYNVSPKPPPDLLGKSKRLGLRKSPITGDNKSSPKAIFLDAAVNKCKIYAFRPFECRLYPFLIALRGKKILLTVDLNCSYIRENLNSKELKEYTQELIDFLNTPAQLKILRDNPQIIQAYEDVLDIIELKIA